MKTPTGPGIERPRLELDVFSVGVIGGDALLGREVLQDSLFSVEVSFMLRPGG